MPQTIAEAALAARRSGDALRCYDLASRGLAEQPNDRRLAYLACLALADLGNLDLAAELYQRHDAGGANDEDWLALRGRLYKELAFRAGAGAPEHYRASAVAYAAAFQATGKSFSGVNAASMSLLAGDAKRAQRMAQAVRDVLAAERPVGDAALYYYNATVAEIALVEGDAKAALRALQSADPYLPLDATGRSRTLRQLRRLCEAQRIDGKVLDALAVPDFVCLLPGASARGPANPTSEIGTRCASVFVVPGQPAEVEIAEEFLAIGTPLHVVLPAERAEAQAQAAVRLGAAWAGRFATLVEKAQEVSTISGFVGGEEERALDYARQVAIGLSRLRAKQTGAAWRVLHTTSGTGVHVRATAAPAGGEHATWSFTSDQPGLRELQRRQAALIFADMTGFSRLPDGELPAYWNRLMPEIARVLSRHSRNVLLQSTWGDALYLVLDTASAAAKVALDVQATLQHVRREFTGSLGTMNVRLSVHYAPVYIGWDPVGLGKLYYGSHVSLAARIEPVTPPGSIYVTEALAAQLTLEGGLEGVELLYAGEVELAKRYGRRRMFHLRSTGAGAAPQAVPHEPDTARELVLGCTGSLILEKGEAEWVRERLRDEVLPKLLEEHQPTNVTLVMGLAPGADLLFAETARDWLSARGQRFGIRTVLPIPPEALLADWNEKLVRTGLPDPEALMRAQWTTMCRVLDESKSVVNLWPAEADVVDLATRSFRERQYRRLGAYLAQYADVLVAICDPGVSGGTGGSVEVLSWRSNRDLIPPPLRGDTAAGVSAGAMVVLNPKSRAVEVR